MDLFPCLSQDLVAEIPDHQKETPGNKKQVNKLSATLLCFKASSPTLLYGSSEYICCVSRSEADRMGIEEEQPGPTVTTKAVAMDWEGVEQM